MKVFVPGDTILSFVLFWKGLPTDNASIEFRNEEEILANSNDPVKTYKEVILPRKLDLYIDRVNNHSSSASPSI